ncbi:MAG: carboxypeptidase-like regulatory domain-containing protein [Candidatus Latescibacter sp.]|nr:carboxypeptidase-like regulatory domain-containing protein [Candidatus Latescibacter sp.]
MKIYLEIGAVLTLIFLVSLSAAIINCSKADVTTSPTDLVLNYSLTGKVVNQNNTPVSGAVVTILRSGFKINSAASGSDGVYTFSKLDPDSYSINATMTGYTFGQILAKVDENSGGSVQSIMLTELAALKNRVEQTVSLQDITQRSVEIKTSYQADVSAGGTTTTSKTQVASVVIPQNTVITINGGAAVDPVKIAVSPMYLDQIPPSPSNELQVGAIILEPINAKFDKPLDVKLPVDVQLPPGLAIPVKKFDNGVWREIGTAVIDNTGLGADTKIQEFGQIAIQPAAALDLITNAPQITTGETKDIPANQKQLEVKISNQITFDQGLPQGITTKYALSLVKKREGTQTGDNLSLSIYLPAIEGQAKPAAILSSEKAEVWVQKCTITMVNISVSKTITLRITAGGLTYSFPITYTYRTTEPQINCTSTWVAHIQGSI